MTITIELNNGSIRTFKHALFNFTEKHPNGTVDFINSTLIVTTAEGEIIKFPPNSWDSFKFSS